MQIEVYFMSASFIQNCNDFNSVHRCQRVKSLEIFCAHDVSGEKEKVGLFQKALTMLSTVF